LLLEEREHFVQGQDGASADEPRGKPPQSVSDNFLAEQKMPPPRVRRAS
jgi:hypothetical protein